MRGRPSSRISASTSSSVPPSPSANWVTRSPRCTFIAVAAIVIVLLQLSLLVFSVHLFGGKHSKNNHKYAVHLSNSNDAAADSSENALKRQLVSSDGKSILAGDERPEPDVQDSFHHQHHNEQQHHPESSSRLQLRQHDAEQRRALAFDAAMKSVYHYSVPKPTKAQSLAASLRSRLGVGKKKSNAEIHDVQKAEKIIDETWKRHLKQYDLFVELQKSLEEEHSAFLKEEKSLVGYQMRQQSSSSSSAATNTVRLALVARDFYAAVDGYFFCAFGSDELRPFQCSGFNWPSAVQLVAETVPLSAEGGGKKKKHHGKSQVGALLTLIDALSTGMLIDSAVSGLLSSSSSSTSPAIVELFEGRFSGPVSTDGEKDDAGDYSHLRALGFSNTTILTLTAIVSQLESRLFSHSDRVLSTFELTIRMVGGLVSAHDLLLRSLELKFGQQHAQNINNNKLITEPVQQLAQRLLDLALKLGNAMTKAFSSRTAGMTSGGQQNSDNNLRPNFASTDRFGFPDPFFRPRDGFSINPRGDKAVYLSEVGTFDLEFAALSQRTGCRIFDALQRQMMQGELKHARPPKKAERRWRNKAWRKRQAREMEESDDHHLQGGSGSSNSNSTSATSTAAAKPIFPDPGLRFSVFHADEDLDNSPGQHNVAVSWRSNEVSLGPLADSFYEYRVKALVAELSKNNNNNNNAVSSSSSCVHVEDATKMLRHLDDELLVPGISADFVRRSRVEDLHRMLAAIDDLMVDCFVPSAEYADEWLRQDDSGSSSDLKLERCFLSKLKSSLRRKRMTHLACFTGGMFAVAATTAGFDDENSNKSHQHHNHRRRLRYLRIAKGLALSCSDMSRLTQEGVAGEDYEAVVELVEINNNNKENRVSFRDSEHEEQEDDAGGENTEQFVFTGMRLTQDKRGYVNQQHVIRPEALEAMYYSAVADQHFAASSSSSSSAQSPFSATMQREAWRLFVGMRRRCRSPKTGGWSGLKLTRPKSQQQMAAGSGGSGGGKHQQQRLGTKLWPTGVQFRDVYDDIQPSFALAETFKYAAMMFADCSSAGAGTSHSSLFLDVACNVALGKEWVLNTEAHPLRI